MEDPGSSCPDVAMEDPESALLQAAMDAPITASLGPMAPLLRQLHSRPKGVGDDKIQLLKDDLVGLCISLKEVSEAAGASFMARWWMKEVRELCYDTQDYLDEASVKHSGDGARRGARLSTGFRVGSKLLWRPQIGRRGQGRCGASRLQQISTKRRNLKRRPRKVAISFSELVARVEVLADASQKFELGLEAIKPDHAQAGVRRLSPRLSLHQPLSMSVHSDAGGLNLVGVEEPVNKLVNLLAFHDDSQKQLMVVSIFGLAGVGKTTVATALYRNFRGKFQCRAFLRVSRTPDMMGILSSILSQIKAPQVGGFPDVQDLIDNIREHLQGKRYFIIIDDLWTTSVWNIISRAFPDGDFCSRIITTSEVEDISLACCSYDSTYIFQMSPLNDDQSRKLFFSRVFGSEDGCPPEFREVSYGIIRKCGGSPLTTVIVASMLAWEPNLVMEQWKHIQDSLPSIMSTSPTSEVTKVVLNLIYNDLPAHLKTCLLHFGVYPEGFTVGKDDLVKQWVAEGLVGIMEEGQNKEKFAGAYFDELVSRGMVQAVDINYSGELLSCTVHQKVLDFIRDKSMEENFAITVDYFQSTLALPDKVRRLSVQFGGAKGAKIPEGIIISQVRSLLFFGFFKCVPLILSYGLLRVLILHIWADEDKIIDLSRISELCRLTYLKIKSNITIKLPAKIGGIQDLETLEVDARLSAVPSDIVHLEKLLHLRLPSESYLPHEVGHMTCLRTLGYFDIGQNSEENVMDLGKLTNLQDLQLTCSIVQAAQNLENNLQLLGSILEKLSILQSVTLVPTVDSNANTLKDHADTSSMSIFCDSLSSVSLAPSLLERIELLPQICIFPRLPKWFEQLGKLRILKIAVRELWGEDIRILKALPALTALSLYVQTAPAEIIVFDKTGFLSLSYLKFKCTTPSLKFESDAMPNLLKLKLSFNAASRVEQHVTASIRIEHLPGLKEISTKIRGAGAISIQHSPDLQHISTEMRTEGTDPEWAWRATIINHKNNPTINVQLVGCFFNGNPSMEIQDKDKVEDDQAVVRVAAHGRWDTSGSRSPYSYRTSVSSLMDLGDEVVEASQAGGEVVEASQPAEDKVFVAVAEELDRGKSALQWALQNLAKDGAQVVVAHVHRPRQMILMMGAKAHHTRLNAEQVKDHRKKELEKAFGKLDEYVVLCKRLKVSCEKIIIENDDVAKGLEELIALHGITKLVMGAASDEHYSKKLKTPKSKTSLRLLEAGASSCKIWFTCKGQLICTREANTVVLVIPPSPTSTVASTLSASSISSHKRSITTHQSESEAPSSNSSPWHDLKRSRTDMIQHSARGAGGTPSQLDEEDAPKPNDMRTLTRPLSSSHLRAPGFDIEKLQREMKMRWLKPREVLNILQNHHLFTVNNRTPEKPPGGSWFLFNRRVHRFFRNDGYRWQKKKSGKTVAEAHEYLKVDNLEAINCYYAHADKNPKFQRRIYWTIEPSYEHIVLVHYRDVQEGSISVSAPNNSSTSTHGANRDDAHSSAGLTSEITVQLLNSCSAGSSEEVSSQILTINNETNNTCRFDWRRTLEMQLGLQNKEDRDVNMEEILPTHDPIIFNELESSECNYNEGSHPYTNAIDVLKNSDTWLEEDQLESFLHSVSIREDGAASRVMLEKAALSIQKNFRSWKKHKEFLTIRKNIIKIQARVRAHQERNKYKELLQSVGILEKVMLRWFRKGVGLRGFNTRAMPIDEDEEEDIARVFRKERVETAVNEAVSRVSAIVGCPIAELEFRRMLEIHLQAKEHDHGKKHVC